MRLLHKPHPQHHSTEEGATTMHRQTRLLTTALLAVLAASGCKRESTDAPATAPTAATEQPATTPEAAVPSQVTYKVEFTPTWTKANFPFEYPDTSLIHKPHFSGWIGTAHNDAYDLFKEGAMPTPGLEALSEGGKHSPLDEEIRAAIAAGNALMLSESEPLKDLSKSATFNITVDDAHPMVSVVAMIAPSPDWFAGVSDVNLKGNGNWIANKTLDVMAWDSGGDDGVTYLANDKDTNPKKPTMPSAAKQFMNDGKAMPVGQISFTRM
jgi:hypothetical protein